MLYLEYAQIKQKCRQAERSMEKILTEKDKLFQKTQPKSTMGEYEREFDKHITVASKGGEKVSAIEEYVIAIEEQGINRRLSEAKKICDEWRGILMIKEHDLRASKNIDDELYCMRFLDHKRVREIARATHYSKSQVYKRLQTISEKIKHETK